MGSWPSSDDDFLGLDGPAIAVDGPDGCGVTSRPLTVYVFKMFEIAAKLGTHIGLLEI